jgi:hypothetical protein
MRQNDKLSNEFSENPNIQNRMKKAILSSRPSGLLLTGVIAVTSALLGLAGTASAQTGPGTGVNVLANPGFETGDFTGWTAYNEVVIANTNGTYYNGGSGGSNQVTHSGSYMAKTYNDDFSACSVNYNGTYQNVPAAGGSTYWSYGWAYTSPEDLIGGADSFWFELEFLNGSGQLLSLWQSGIISNSPAAFPDNLWVELQITNQYEVSNPGTSTAAATTTIIGNTGASGIITAPAGTSTVRYQAVFRGASCEGGSVYYDDNYLDLVTGPTPPYFTNYPSLNNVILATNRSFTYTVVSPANEITNVQVVVATHGFTGITNTVTNALTSTNLTVTGIGTGSATVTIPLQSNLVYSLTIYGTDNNGLTTTATESFDTIAPSLVIEAEDFNFSGGGYSNTPPDGGLALYTNQVGVQGIDEFGTWGNGAQGYYRPQDAVVIQAAAPDNGTEQKYIISEAAGDSVDVPVEVGYNAPNDGLNYTRDFGSSPTNSAPAGAYRVYARFATDGDGNPGVGFGMVTNDPTQTTQGVLPLGTFTFSDSDWNGFDYVPLLDQYGNLVSVNLSGHETFMLIPVTPILTPVLSYIYPDGSHPFEYTNKWNFTVGAANGAGISASGIDVILNGVDVTSKLTMTGATNSWNISYPLTVNTPYSAVISVTNSDGLSSVFTKTFDTFNPTNFQFEANDYDFSTNGVGGLFIDNPVPTCDTTATEKGTFATNSYFGYPEDLIGLAIAVQGVDFTSASAQPVANDYYRADGQGSQPASDYVRPKFVAAQLQFSDPNIGPFNLGWTTTGDWDNYTRTYPTNSFYVYGRLAGGAGAWSNQFLQIVTSGVGTSDQTTNMLGSFSDTTAAGYQAWHWVPCLDTNGSMVVVSLSGKATLRTVCGGPGVNEEFYMLVPAPLQVNLTASLVGGQLNIVYPTEIGHNYTLLYSPSLLNPTWTAVGSAVAGTGNPQSTSVSKTGTQGYYVVSVQ